jgi:hypothetical protein
LVTKPIVFSWSFYSNHHPWIPPRFKWDWTPLHKAFYSNAYGAKERVLGEYDISDGKFKEFTWNGFIVSGPDLGSEKEEFLVKDGFFIYKGDEKKKRECIGIFFYEENIIACNNDYESIFLENIDKRVVNYTRYRYYPIWEVTEKGKSLKWLYNPYYSTDLIRTSLKEFDDDEYMAVTIDMAMPTSYPYLDTHNNWSERIYWIDSNRVVYTKTTRTRTNAEKPCEGYCSDKLYVFERKDGKFVSTKNRELLEDNINLLLDLDESKPAGYRRNFGVMLTNAAKNGVFECFDEDFE